MSVALVIISDGRGYLAESIPSLIENADPSWFSSAFIVEDGDMTDHATQACKLLRDWLGCPVTLRTHPGRLGGAAAVNSAWEYVAHEQPDYVFHLEEDFLFNGPVPLPEMLALLESDASLAQMCLRRQRWGAEGPGGFIGDSPDKYVDTGAGWLRHTQQFSLNPCVYPAWVTRDGWPAGGHEHHFTKRIVDEGFHFGVLGSHEDEPRVIHIGFRRAAAWTW